MPCHIYQNKKTLINSKQIDSMKKFVLAKFSKAVFSLH